MADSSEKPEDSAPPSMLDAAAKVIDSKTVQRFYKEAVSPVAKQVGGLATDLVKTFRLFTAPLQLAAAAQDRFSVWLEDVRKRVPTERQVEAPPEVAGPVLMNLRFIGDDNILKELYLNLLARAIDTERKEEAHPGFIKLIEQMSPSEAMTFKYLCLIRQQPKNEQPNPEWSGYVDKRHQEVERLISMGIVTRGPLAMWNGQFDFQSPMPTPFGHAFFRCCFPDAAEQSQAIV